MATHTLTAAAPSQTFTLAEDGTVQVIISSAAIFDGATFGLEYETATTDVYIPIPSTKSAEPYSRIFTFKAGKIKLVLGNASAKSSVKVDIK